MGQDNYGNTYEVTSSGTNQQGNQYDSRDYGPDAPNQNSYHYSNQDDSYYYSNPDGSTYHNDGKGGENYQPPSELLDNETASEAQDESGSEEEYVEVSEGSTSRTVYDEEGGENVIVNLGDPEDPTYVEAPSDDDGEGYGAVEETEDVYDEGY